MNNPDNKNPIFLIRRGRNKSVYKFAALFKNPKGKLLSGSSLNSIERRSKPLPGWLYEQMITLEDLSSDEKILLEEWQTPRFTVSQKESILDKKFSATALKSIIPFFEKHPNGITGKSILQLLEIFQRESSDG